MSCLINMFRSHGFNETLDVAFIRVDQKIKIG